MAYTKEKLNAWMRQWRLKNPEKARLIDKKSKDKNKEKYKETNKISWRKWSRAHPNYSKEYRETNRVSLAQKRQTHIKTNIQFHLACRLRTRLSNAIRKQVKSGSAVRDLGCTISELKLYLEEQFQNGMSWDNWGMDGWHIDHKIPLVSFDLTIREQLLQAVHYTNLQPMWAVENMQKGSKLSLI